MSMPAVTRPNPGDPADSGATQDTTIVDQLADRDDYLDGAKEATGVAATLDAAHVAASDPHGDRAAATAALSAHEADTTAVHGITDTSALVLTGDPRLTDTRTPTDGSVTTAKLGARAVTWAKAQAVATARILGRKTAGSGDVEELTGADVAAMLPDATATVRGLVPTPPNDTAKFLRGDGTFAAPAGGGGTTILAGTGEPTGATGADGNYYIRDPGSTFHFELLYGPKAAGSWPKPLLILKGSANVSASTSGIFAAGTPIYMAKQNIYISGNAGGSGGDKLVVNTQYLTGPPAGNTRLASGPAGVSYKMGFWGAAGAPMLGLAAVSARQASLPSTGSQGVGFAMCDAAGIPSGVVATCNSAGALRIEGWSGTSVLAASGNGLVVAGDIIALVVNGGMLTASCFDGSTNGLKGRVEALMPSGDDATYAQEVGMFWLNDGNGKQLLLRGAY